MDYYTTWVHQIKTPISAMKMMLGHKVKIQVRAGNFWRAVSYRTVCRDGFNLFKAGKVTLCIMCLRM